MPSDEELTFADHAGRFYARRYGMAPMVGRLVGYLAVCDPREQSITELADALLASRSAIAGAVNTLESIGLIRRSRAAGERMDRVCIDMSSPRAMGFDPSEYQEQGELAREGLRLLGGRPARTEGDLVGVGGVCRFPGGAASRDGTGVEEAAGEAASRRRTPRGPGSPPKGER